MICMIVFTSFNDGITDKAWALKILLYTDGFEKIAVFLYGMNFSVKYIDYAFWARDGPPPPPMPIVSSPHLYNSHSDSPVGVCHVCDSRQLLEGDRPRPFVNWK